MCCPRPFSLCFASSHLPSVYLYVCMHAACMLHVCVSQTAASLALAAVLCVVEGMYTHTYMYMCWPLLAPALLVALYRRSLVFELLLLVHVIESSLGSWHYFSRIDQYLYLGGIPLKSLDHISVLTLDHKVQAVLSVNEAYELQAVTLAGSPVSAGEWKVSPCRFRAMM